MSKARKVGWAITGGRVDWRDADKRAARNSKIAASASREIAKKLDDVSLRAKTSTAELLADDDDSVSRQARFESEAKPLRTALRKGWMTQQEFDSSLAQLATKHRVAPPSAAAASLAGKDATNPGTLTLGEQLAQLAELHRSGALTNDEFTAAKARLLQ